MSAWVRALREALASAPLRQPDVVSCGACVAELATAALQETPPPAAPDFAASVLARHRQLTSSRDVHGRLQVPWPRWWGTPPWALARHLTLTTGRGYRVLWARTRTTWAATPINRALTAGAPVPLYVGSPTLPRHVVLALPDPADDTWTVYDPASGLLRHLPAHQWRHGRIRTGWPRPWFAVVPRRRDPS